LIVEFTFKAPRNAALYVTQTKAAAGNRLLDAGGGNSTVAKSLPAHSRPFRRKTGKPALITSDDRSHHL
jgi:hypothetical protein